MTSKIEPIPCPAEKCIGYAKPVALRVPPNPSASMAVEYVCETWGCRSRLVPFFVEVPSDEDALAWAFGRRATVTRSNGALKPMEAVDGKEIQLGV